MRRLLVTEFTIPLSIPPSQSFYILTVNPYSPLLLDDIDGHLSVLLNLILECEHQSLGEALPIEELHYFIILLLIE